MSKKGFHCADFARIPNDMSSGSREVLLALGWLLCKKNVVAQFINNATSPLDDDTASLHKVSFIHNKSFELNFHHQLITY